MSLQKNEQLKEYLNNVINGCDSIQKVKFMFPDPTPHIAKRAYDVVFNWHAYCRLASEGSLEKQRIFIEDILNKHEYERLKNVAQYLLDTSL